MGDRRYSAIYGSTLAAFCMAECLDQRQARDIPRLASEEFSVALAMEVETAREAPRAHATSGTDLQDGPPEPNVGRGAHRCRVAYQTRHSSIPANGEALYAQ